VNEELKDALVLLAEIAGLLAAFVILLFILNFFNLLSLSKMYPRELGFLPHLSQASSVKPTIQTQTHQVVTNNQTSLLGYLSGHNNNSLQITTQTEVVNLAYNSSTVFEGTQPATQAANMIAVTPINAEDFFKQVSPGASLQITVITSASGKFAKEVYVPLH
jgi:hypothetical protein